MKAHCKGQPLEEEKRKKREVSMGWGGPEAENWKVRGRTCREDQHD